MNSKGTMKPRTPLLRLVPYVLALLAAFVLFAPGAAIGQQGAATWSIQPASADGADSRPHFVYDNVEPGATISDFVLIRNLSDEELTLAVYASDALNTTRGGFDLLPADTAPVGLGAWVETAEDTVTIGPRDSVIVPFSIHIPENATPGDHAAGIVAVFARSGADSGGGQVSVHYRVGTRIYLRLSGELAPALSITDLSVSYSGTLSPTKGGDLNVAFTVSNDGNMRLTGEPRIEVTGPLGIGLQEAFLEPLPELLPGSTYTVEAVVAGVVPLLRANARIVIEPQAVGGDGPAVLTVSQAAGSWALPLPQLAVLVLIGGAIVIARRTRVVERLRSKPGEAISPEVVDNIKKYLNVESPALPLAICRTIGRQADAGSAVMTGLNTGGIEFVAIVDGRAVPVTVSWSQTVRTEPEIRAELARIGEQVKVMETVTSAGGRT